MPYGSGCQHFNTTDGFDTILHFEGILTDQTGMMNDSLCASLSRCLLPRGDSRF